MVLRKQNFRRLRCASISIEKRTALVFRTAMLLLPLVAAGARQGYAQTSKPDIRDEILAAEDRRAPDQASLDVLTRALTHPDPAIKRLAVRALGRLERPALVSVLAPMLASPDAGVRAEAANALAQAVSASSPASVADTRSAKAPGTVAEVQSLLAKQLEREADADVRGILCESLGRLAYRNAAEAQAAEQLLVATTFSAPAGPDDALRGAPISTLSGAVKGLESLLRQNAKFFTPAPATIERLKQLAGLRTATALPTQATKPKPGPTEPTPLKLDPTGVDDAARVRRLALLALAPRSGDLATLTAAMIDDEWEVRRIAVRAAGPGLRNADSEVRRADLALVMRGLGDSHWRVRYEALSALGRNQAAPECRILLTAVADANAHVSLLAVDLLPKCGATSDAPRVLGGLVRVLPSADGPWQRPAHALVSFARLAPEQAAAQLPRFVASPIWQVRAYAARAAAAAKASGVLHTLASDDNDNVCTAAITGLAELEQHAADAVYLSALTRTDGQLLMTAARALQATPDRLHALPALAQALAGLTKQHRDTSRDVRLALLDRIGELGSREQAGIVETYVRDFDPRIARAAASIVKQWTGVDLPLRYGSGGAGRAPRTAAVMSAPPPAFAEVRQLEGATAVVRMKNRGTFTLALLVSEAPAAVVRFAKLARAGYYNGLTFHRVEPASLIQGGSPGANEYAGDSPFMRDELGFASNRRGSVGISTRGRDTGDAQWYINLVDNARYDHNYTVFAFVRSGMDVVDAILEGDVIEEVRIVVSSE